MQNLVGKILMNEAFMTTIVRKISGTAGPMSSYQTIVLCTKYDVYCDLTV